MCLVKKGRRIYKNIHAFTRAKCEDSNANTEEFAHFAVMLRKAAMQFGELV